MSSFLRLHQLSYRYEEAASDTVSPINLSIAAGEIAAIVGESGSGKTTLLQLIGGKLEPTNGRIWLEDEPVTGPAYNLVPGHPAIRTVFQDFSLSPNLSVYQNIAHVLRAYRSDYREARTHELIERFRLSGRETQLPATLSGGEKQRVALARALAEEPTLLLMDEPFSQVDFPLKRHLIHEITDFLRQTGGTALFVTHDARDALALADQIIVLQHGKIVQQGTPPQVYEQPVSPYVAQLTGDCCVIAMAVWHRWFPDFAASDATQIGIRPEWVRWLADEEEGIRGKVIRSTYRGAYYELTIRAEEATLIAHSSEEIAADTPVVVGLEAERAIRFADPSS